MKYFTYKFISLFALLFTMSFSINGQEETHTQTLSFPEGWSLFSINIHPSSGLTIGSLFNEVSDDIIIIRNSIGNAYLPAFEFDGIGDVNHAEAYAIKTLNPFTLNITGQIVSPEDIIIDNIKSPDRILGMSDGKGDFIRNLNKDQKTRINKIKSFLKNEN